MSKTAPRFYQIELSRALKEADKFGRDVEIENGVIRIVKSGDSGESAKAKVAKKQEPVLG